MKTVILLSGGQDSTTALYWALKHHEVVEAVSFDYGQRHRFELQLAKKIAESNGVPWTGYEVPSLSQLAQSSLTNDAIGNESPSSRGLPSSFTPGRNLLFFTIAAAHAEKVGADSILTGVCQQDDAGYPDCREAFVEQMERAIRVGFDWPSFVILAPLLRASKGKTWELAEDLGIVDLIVESTNTCYEGDREHKHEWGYGCGVCGACVERARGFNEFAASRGRRHDQ